MDCLKGMDSHKLSQCLCLIPGGLYTPRYFPYGMGGVQPRSMDSIWTTFWLATQPFFHSIPTMESTWNPYGMDHSMDIPCSSPCGFLVDSMEFPMNLHC